MHKPETEQMGEAMIDIEKAMGSVSIVRPKLARWLKVREWDILRWMFWESYGKDGPDEEELAQLKHDVMDNEWPMFEKMLEAGPPGWWMRLRCRLVSGEERSIGVWAAQHNFYRSINRSADPEWEKRQARERIKKFEQEKDHYLCDILSVADDYELVGEKEKAEVCYNAYYKQVVGGRFAGCKWPESKSS